MEIAGYIDHTLLRADATEAELRRLCAEAAQYGFHSVCVNGSRAALCAQLLKGTGVALCVVCGFPLGAASSAAKAAEAADAVKNGATEIDMVINIGRLKDKDLAYVERDIAAVVSAVSGKAIVKAILETCLLTDAEIEAACRAAKGAGAAFVKTSTGFSTGGATEKAVALMRRAVGDSMGVKASGGVRTRADAERLIAAGATRLGASAGVAIVSEN